MCRKILIVATMLLAGNAYADTYNNLSVQGQLAQPTPIYGVGVRVVSGGQVVGTGTDVDLLPDSNGIFSTQTYITDPWAFRTGEDYILRLSSPTSGEMLSTFTITGVPFAHVVRGDTNTGDQNIFASYGNAGIGTASPQYRLVVSSGGSNLMWVADDGVHAAKFIGDGSDLTGISGVGDSLGTHIATQTLDMAGYGINNVSTMTATGLVGARKYQISNGDVLALKGSSDSGVAIGPNAGQANISSGGQSNVFVGKDAGYTTYLGHTNVFVGSGAGYLNGEGYGNTAIGTSAGHNLTTGYYNTYLGAASGQTNTGWAIQDACVGAFSCRNSNGGNSVLGYNAATETAGSGNIYIGREAATNMVSGDGNIVIGAGQELSSTSSSNELNIGGVIFGKLSAKTVGISTRAPQAALDVVSTGTAANVYVQIWRNGNGVVVASMTSQGMLYATLANAGDNLGTHMATQKLDMANNQILNVSSLTVTGKDASGYSLSLSSGIVMPAGTVTAGLFDGNGAMITALNASNLALGTVADARLSANINLLGANQTVAGVKTYASSVTITANAFSVAGTTLTVANGTIGINSAPSPYVPLFVNGSSKGYGIYSYSTRTSGVNNGLVSEITGAATTNTALFLLAANATNNRALYIEDGYPSAGANNYAIYDNSGAQSYFKGNLGIGTTTPTSKLEVVGDSKFSSATSTTTFSGWVDIGFVDGPTVTANQVADSVCPGGTKVISGGCMTNSYCGQFLSYKLNNTTWRCQCGSVVSMTGTAYCARIK